ncbi:MAG: D-alanine--D-alanine ligase A [Chloroflexi bacterium RBG_16_57_11]|nr:MAG: D-alanine--D-alanine ligase A [Chloroflexi bacterium RBG_16_57_11]
MAKKLRVGLIFGGRSGEHEVSLMSARSLLAAIDPEKYAITQIGISHNGAWLVGENVLDALELSHTESYATAAIWPDPTRNGIYTIRSTAEGEMLSRLGELEVVFPVLHGTFGEDGTLQGLLELAELAYVGAGVLGSALGMDKAVFKSVMRAHGIPVVDWVAATRSEIQQDIHAVIDRARGLGDFPLFIKPANLGSSVGITRCMSISDVMEGLYEAARFDRRVLIERGIKNPREIEVSVLGNDSPVTSVPGEILPSRNFYSYESKYLDGTSRLLIPAPITAELTLRIQSLAIQAYHAIDCAGMARVDFLLAQEAGDFEGLYLGELNTIPGFTQISMYPKLWEHSGLSYPALIDRLIELALERKIERDRTERRFHRES